MPSAPLLASEYPKGVSVHVPGARLYYLDTGGSGTPVVFMHAATGSYQSWGYQIPAFTAAGYWEQPDIFNHTILTFIQRVDRQVGSRA